MNWEAIGAIGEIVGATAVVLSLVYVAAQVRQNTGALRGAAAAEAVAAIREFNRSIIDDPALAEIFMRGIEGMENLSAEEKVRFVPVMFNFFKTCEHLHYQFVRGYLDPEVWAGWEVALRGYLSSPGGMDYYRQRRETLSPTFQAWVEGATSRPSLGRMGDFAGSDGGSDR